MCKFIKEFTMWFIMTTALLIGGCATLDSMFIPEAGQDKADVVIVAEGVTGALATTGNPYAVPALAGSTILSIIAGAYTTMRKKQMADTEKSKASDYKIIVESLVSAIEEAKNVKINDKGKTIGDVVKTKVEKNLRDNDAYLIGRAIIEAMKESK